MPRQTRLNQYTLPSESSAQSNHRRSASTSLPSQNKEERHQPSGLAWDLPNSKVSQLSPGSSTPHERGRSQGNALPIGHIYSVFEARPPNTWVDREKNGSDEEQEKHALPPVLSVGVPPTREGGELGAKPGETSGSLPEAVDAAHRSEELPGALSMPSTGGVGGSFSSPESSAEASKADSVVPLPSVYSAHASRNVVGEYAGSPDRSTRGEEGRLVVGSWRRAGWASGAEHGPPSPSQTGSGILASSVYTLPVPLRSAVKRAKSPVAPGGGTDGARPPMIEVAAPAAKRPAVSHPPASGSPSVSPPVTAVTSLTAENRDAGAEAVVSAVSPHRSHPNSTLLYMASKAAAEAVLQASPQSEPRNASSVADSPFRSAEPCSTVHPNLASVPPGTPEEEAVPQLKPPQTFFDFPTVHEKTVSLDQTSMATDDERKTCNLSFLLNRSASTLNFNALITELEQRRNRLREKLSQMAKKVAEHSIFAIIRTASTTQLLQLLETGVCNVNEQDHNGCTALHIAASEGNEPLAQLLISYGADILKKDSFGRTPLDCAAANRQSISRFLVHALREQRENHGLKGKGAAMSGLVPSPQDSQMVGGEVPNTVKAHDNAGVPVSPSSQLSSSTDGMVSHLPPTQNFHSMFLSVMSENAAPAVPAPPQLPSDAATLPPHHVPGEEARNSSTSSYDGSYSGASAKEDRAGKGVFPSVVKPTETHGGPSAGSSCFTWLREPGASPSEQSSSRLPLSTSNAVFNRADLPKDFFEHRPTILPGVAEERYRAATAAAAAAAATSHSRKEVLSHDSPPSTVSPSITPPPAGLMTQRASVLDDGAIKTFLDQFVAQQQHRKKPIRLEKKEFSVYTTVNDSVPVVLCMSGLPGRGKSFISKRLVRYLNWKGVPCAVFNAGNYRRKLLGADGTAHAAFFDPANPVGKELRERMAELACADLMEFIADHYPLAVGILDATNTTRARRKWLEGYFAEASKKHVRADGSPLEYRFLFIESVCTDENIITENILRSKCDNDDFKGTAAANEVISEFRERIRQYEKVYEPLHAEENFSFIKIINIKHHVVLHRVSCGLGSRIAFFLLNLHPIAFPVYVALPGETVGESEGVFGGDQQLTERGIEYAHALHQFMENRFASNMLVIHSTSKAAVNTLLPSSGGFPKSSSAGLETSYIVSPTSNGGESGGTGEFSGVGAAKGNGGEDGRTAGRKTLFARSSFTKGSKEGGSPSLGSSLTSLPYPMVPGGKSHDRLLLERQLTNQAAVPVVVHRGRDPSRGGWNTVSPNRKDGLPFPAGGGSGQRRVSNYMRSQASTPQNPGRSPVDGPFLNTADPKNCMEGTAFDNQSKLSGSNPSSAPLHEGDVLSELLTDRGGGGPKGASPATNTSSFTNTPTQPPYFTSGGKLVGGQMSTPTAKVLNFPGSEPEGAVRREGHGLIDAQGPYVDQTGDYEDEDLDQVLCPVPGLDDVNFGKLNGKSPQWLEQQNEHVAQILFSKTLEDKHSLEDQIEIEETEESELEPLPPLEDDPQEGGTHGIGRETPAPLLPMVIRGENTQHTIADLRNCSKRFEQHFANASYSSSRAPNFYPTLNFTAVFPNGESVRQVVSRLEPALMAVMRSQKPVFVIAPMIPVQGLLAFFLDVVPEKSTLLKLPKNGVLEITVKGDVVVHPLPPPTHE